MGNINERRSSDESLRHPKDRCEDEGMADKVKSFRALAQSSRKRTGTHRQTPSQVLIRDDRDCEHRSG